MIPLFALYAAIIVYCLFSSPTPDHAGWPEYLAAVLLLASVGTVRLWNRLSTSHYPPYLSFHRFFILYMFSIPLAIGLIAGNDAGDIIRDMIPLAFLCLPLCFSKEPAPYFEAILTIAGAGFAIRYLFPSVSGAFDDSQNLLYLANSPLLPFATIMGFHYLSLPRKHPVILRLLGLTCSIACLTAMAIMLQRAPFILSVAGCLSILALRSSYRHVTAMVIGLLAIIPLLYIGPYIADIVNNMTDKTLSVGLNNRTEEWQAVLAQATLFGQGWGALWQSPAVADIWVRYTHNIVSYYWLKTGMTGASLALCLVYMWGRQIIILIRHNPAVGIAVFVPFLIHVTLYTGFKTLDFALILTLVTVRCQTVRNQS